MKVGSIVWLVYLGKALPFIGAGVVGIINAIGYNIISYFDNILNNHENRVILIKGKIFASQNIMFQVEKIIQQNKNIKFLKYTLLS